VIFLRAMFFSKRNTYWAVSSPTYFTGRVLAKKTKKKSSECSWGQGRGQRADVPLPSAVYACVSSMCTKDTCCQYFGQYLCTRFSWIRFPNPGLLSARRVSVLHWAPRVPSPIRQLSVTVFFIARPWLRRNWWR